LIFKFVYLLGVFLIDRFLLLLIFQSEIKSAFPLWRRPAVVGFSKGRFARW